MLAMARLTTLEIHDILVQQSMPILSVRDNCRIRKLEYENGWFAAACLLPRAALAQTEAPQEGNIGMVPAGSWYPVLLHANLGRPFQLVCEAPGSRFCSAGTRVSRVQSAGQSIHGYRQGARGKQGGQKQGLLRHEGGMQHVKVGSNQIICISMFASMEMWRRTRLADTWRGPLPCGDRQPGGPDRGRAPLTSSPSSSPADFSLPTMLRGTAWYTTLPPRPCHPMQTPLIRRATSSIAVQSPRTPRSDPVLLLPLPASHRGLPSETPTQHDLVALSSQHHRSTQPSRGDVHVRACQKSPDPAICAATAVCLSHDCSHPSATAH